MTYMSKKPVAQNNVTKKHINRSYREQKQLKIIYIVTGVVLAIIIALVAYGLIDSYLVKPNKVVAKVGETSIKAGEFQTQVKYSRFNYINQAYTFYQYSQMFGSYGSSYLTAAQNMVNQLFDTNGIGENVLDTMIENILIAEEAEKIGVTVSKEEIDLALQEAFEFFPNGTYTPTITATSVYTPTISETQLAILKYTDTPTPLPTSTNTPEGWEPTNTATNTPPSEPTTNPEISTTASEESDPAGTATPIPTNTVTPTPTPYTTQGYAKAVKTYLDNLSSVNLSREQLREVFKNQLLREKMVEALFGDLDPVEDQVWVRHILVDSEEKATEIRERIISGEDWNELVTTENETVPESVTSEDLGWFGKGVMEEAFEIAAFKLETVGEISEPIQTSFGWHVIQLIGKGPIALNSSDYVNLKETMFAEWLTDLKSTRTDIVKLEGWEKLIPETPEVPTSFLTELYSTISQ